jgi:hypothetical protein
MHTDNVENYGTRGLSALNQCWTNECIHACPDLHLCDKEAMRFVQDCGGLLCLGKEKNRNPVSERDVLATISNVDTTDL